jgi:hypothetical protein
MPDIVKLTDTSRARLLAYLEEEHERAKREVYEPLQSKRNEWEDAYAGRVKPRSSDWMSNVSMGLGATYTDATTARFLNTMTAYKPTFSVHALRDSSWVKVAKGVEDMFEFKVQREMRYYDVMRRCVFETCRLGTGAYLAPWVEEYEYLPYKKYGFIPSQQEIPTIQSVVLKGLPLRDLYVPGGYSEVHELPWWGRNLVWTPLELEMARKDKFFDSADIDKLLAFKGPVNEPQQAAQERSGEIAPSGPKVEGIETWIKFDVEKKGLFGKYIVKWHPASRTIMKVEVDDYPEWPLFLFRYGPRDYGIFGLGVMEMAQSYETALWALVNLLIDNFKIATMQCYKGRKGKSLRSDTDIYPGKLFLLDDPEKDLMSFPMGSSFNLNPSFIRMVMDLSERRTGINDYSMGRESPSVGGRATATATLALIQEGARRFDLCIRDIRQVQDGFGNYALRMFHRHLPRSVPYMLLGDKRGAETERWLEMPKMGPQYSIALVSNLSNLALNKEVAKQDAQQTMMLLAQFYTQMTQLSMQIDSPMTPPNLKMTLMKIREAAADKFRSVLEVYGEPSPERYTDMFVSGIPPDVGGGAPMAMPPNAMGVPPGPPAGGPAGGLPPELLAMLSGGGAAPEAPTQ